MIKRTTLLMLLVLSIAAFAQLPSPMWDFAIFIDYLANDSLRCDSLRNMAAEDATISAIDYATEVDSTDSTWHGIYVKIWARKVANDGSGPENAGPTATSYSDTFYTAYEGMGGELRFTMQQPYPTYLLINFPLENLRCIDNITPFGYDAYDTLYIYAEDRYGNYSKTDPSTATDPQWFYIDTAYATDPGTADQHWHNEEDTLNPYYPGFYGFYYMTYHPDTCASHAVHEKPSLPTVPTLGQNSPNPFNSSTEITFTLPEGANVELVVTDVLGKHVATLFDGFKAKGNHTLKWNGLDDEKELVPSGVYFYKLTVGDNFVDKKKMTLIK